MGRGHKQSTGKGHGSSVVVSSAAKNKLKANNVPAVPVSLNLVVPLPVAIPDSTNYVVANDENATQNAPASPEELRHLLLVRLPQVKLMRHQLIIVSSVRALVRRLSKSPTTDTTPKDAHLDAWVKDLSCAVLLFTTMMIESPNSRYQLLALLQSCLVALKDLLPAAILEATRVSEVVAHALNKSIVGAQEVDAAHQLPKERHFAVTAWVHAASCIERAASWNVTCNALVTSLGRVYVVEALLAACTVLDKAIPAHNLVQGGMMMELADISLRVLDACSTFMAAPNVLYTLQVAEENESERARRLCSGTDADQLTEALVKFGTILRRWLSVSHLPKDVHLKSTMVLWALHVHVSTASAFASTQTSSIAPQAALISFSQWLDTISNTQVGIDAAQLNSKILPINDELTGLNIIGRMAIVRAVITAVPCKLLLQPLQSFDGSTIPALLPRVYPIFAKGCRSGGVLQRLFVFHGLDSFATLIAQASADGTIQPVDFDSWLGEQVTDASELVLANWDFPSRRITILMPKLFGSLLSVCATMYAVPNSTSVPDWRPEVFKRLLTRTVGSQQVIYKGIFEALGMLIPPLGARNVLASHPSLVQDLVWMVQHTDVGPAVSSTLMQLLQGLAQGNGGSVDVVCAAVVEPLANALTSPIATLRVNVVNFAMPKLVKAFPALVVPLHNKLCEGNGSLGGNTESVNKSQDGNGSRVQAMSVEGDTDAAKENVDVAPVVLDPEMMSHDDLSLLGEISMLSSARKLGFDVEIVEDRNDDVDDDKSMIPEAAAEQTDAAIQSPNPKRLRSSSERKLKKKKKMPLISLTVPVSRVAQGVESADPELQLMAIGFVLSHRKLSDLPTLAELAVLRCALVATVRVPTPDARGKLNAMFAKLFDRFRTANAAAERSLKSLTRFNQMSDEQVCAADSVRNSIAASRSFLVWAQELCLASIYPDAPFERTGTALELLNSIMLTLGKAEVVTYEKKVQEFNNMSSRTALQSGTWPSHLGSHAQGIEGEDTEGPQTNSLIAPLLTPNTVNALVNMMLNSFDRARVLSQSILMQLPTPLPGFETRVGVQSLLRWALLLLASVKVRECDAGALLLELVRSKYVVKLGWVLDIPGSSAPNWALMTPAKNSDKKGLDGIISAEGSEAGPAYDVAAQVQSAVQHARDAVYMSFAVAQAKQSVPSERAYCVGAVAVSGFTTSSKSSSKSGSKSGDQGPVASWLPSGEILAAGFSRECWGNTHAEEVVLKKVGEYSGSTPVNSPRQKPTPEDPNEDDAKGRAVGSTLYTTMEPCSERLSGNRTCTSRIIAGKVARVVIGVLEPNKFVAECQGAKILQEHGVVVEMLSDSAIEKECMSPNMFLFPNDKLKDEETRSKILQNVMNKHVNVAHAQDLPRDLAQLYFLWQLMGLFEERLQGLRLTHELSDVSAALAKASMSRSYSTVGADEPTTVAIKRSLVMDVNVDLDTSASNEMSDPARNGVRPVYVHGALLALRYTWQRATESIKAAKGNPNTFNAWRLLVDHTLDRVMHGLQLAMQVLGESDDEEEEEEEKNGISVDVNGVNDVNDLNADSAKQDGRQRVTNLKGGAPTVAKNLKVDCRGHLIMETGDVAEGQGEQLVVVAGWLIVKEGSSLLGALVEHARGVLSDTHLMRVGDLFLHMLLTAKHQGAISHAGSSFQRVCEALMRESMSLSLAHHGANANAPAPTQDVTMAKTSEVGEPTAAATQTSISAHLPGTWLTRLLSRLEESEQAFVLRRSVGFASCFMAIVRAEPQNCPPVLLQRLLSRIFALVRDGLATNDEQTSTTTDWRVLVHCLNILKLLVSDSTLAAQLQDRLPLALELSVFGFRSPVWSVRNSSMMVFAAVLDRMIGASRKNAKLGNATHGISSAQLFNCHTTLRPFLLRELSTAVQHSNTAITMAESIPKSNVSNVSKITEQDDIHPSLYPLLLLLSHVREAGSSMTEQMDDEDENEEESEVNINHSQTSSSSRDSSASMTPFVELVLSCAAQRHFAVRNMAANALASMLSPSSVPHALKHLSDSLWEACTVTNTPNHNLVHGLLLQARGLLGTLATLQGLGHVITFSASSSPVGVALVPEPTALASHLDLPREQMTRIVHVAVRVARHQHMAALSRTAAVDVLNGLDTVFGALADSARCPRLTEAVNTALVYAAHDHLCVIKEQPQIHGKDNQVLGDRLALSATRIVLASLTQESASIGADSWGVAAGLVTLPSSKIRCEPLKRWCRLLKSQTVKLDKQKTMLGHVNEKEEQEMTRLPPTDTMIKVCTFLVAETLRDAQALEVDVHNADAEPWALRQPYIDELCARLRLLRMVIRLELLPDWTILQADELVRSLLALSARFSHASLRSAVIRLVGTILTNLSSAASSTSSCDEWARTLRVSASYSARVEVRVGVAKALQECSHVLLLSPAVSRLSAYSRANAWIAVILLLDDEDSEVRERVRRASQVSLPSLQGGAPVAERVRAEALRMLASDTELVRVPAWQEFVLAHVVATSQASGLPAVNGATASSLPADEGVADDVETLSSVLGQLVGAGKDLGLLSTRVFEVEPDNLFAEPVLLSAALVEHVAAVLKNDGDGGELRAKLVVRVKRWIQDLCASLPLLAQAQLDAHRLGGATFHQAVHAQLVSMLYALGVLWASGVVEKAFGNPAQREELMSGCAVLQQSAVGSVPRGIVKSWYAMEWSVERALGRLIECISGDGDDGGLRVVCGLAGFYRN